MPLVLDERDQRHTAGGQGQKRGKGKHQFHDGLRRNMMGLVISIPQT